MAVATPGVGTVTTRPIKTNADGRSHSMIRLVTTSVTLVSTTAPSLRLIVMLLRNVSRSVWLMRSLTSIAKFLRRRGLLVSLKSITIGRKRAGRPSIPRIVHLWVTLPVVILLGGPIRRIEGSIGIARDRLFGEATWLARVSVGMGARMGARALVMATTASRTTCITVPIRAASLNRRSTCVGGTRRIPIVFIDLARSRCRWRRGRTVVVRT